MTTVIEPGAQAPILVIQEEGLPLVVVQPPDTAGITVIQAVSPALLYVAPQAPPLTIVINPTLGGPPPSSSGYPPITYQLTGASDWYQTHGFPYLPEVRLVEDGRVVDSAVEYPSGNSVYLTFPSPFTGYVILS